MKKIFAISFLSICILFHGCDNGHETESTNLSLSFSEDPPSSYDCNNESRFEVSLIPYNEPQMTGDYLWMFFKLQIDTVVFYESNDIQFPISEAGDHIPYTLEFGGAIEGENFRYNYDIVGYLFRVVDGDPVEGTCTEGSYISVTEKTNFSKTMHIEYDCQSSYNIGADTLDTFGKLAAAFHIADTDTELLWDEMNIQDSTIAEVDLGYYHFIHWSNTAGYNMHLLAIEGIENNTDSTNGMSINGPYGWSYVFVQDIFNFNPAYPELALHKTVVHELGHQRAALTDASGRYDPHPEDHDSPFCAMNQGISHVGNNDNNPDNDPPGLRRYFDTNPHFCDMCITTIKNISW